MKKIRFEEVIKNKRLTNYEETKEAVLQLNKIKTDTQENKRVDHSTQHFFRSY